MQCSNDDNDSRGDQVLRRELRRSISEQLGETCKVEVFVFGDFAWLLGEVVHPLARLLAEDVVCSHPGIRDCFNEIVVGSAGASIAA